MPGKISYPEILDKLKALANPENVAGMAGFAINPRNTLGVSMPNLRKFAREIGMDHKLAVKVKRARNRQFGPFFANIKIGANAVQTRLKDPR